MSYCRHNDTFGWGLGLLAGLIFFWIVGVVIVGVIWFLWTSTSTWTTFPRRLARTLIVLLVLFVFLL
jgi:hypothetical protein